MSELDAKVAKVLAGIGLTPADISAGQLETLRSTLSAADLGYVADGSAFAQTAADAAPSMDDWLRSNVARRRVRGEQIFSMITERGNT